MKKILSITLITALFLTIIGCAETGETLENGDVYATNVSYTTSNSGRSMSVPAERESEVEYLSIQITALPSKDAEELTETADVVIIGEVTGISFEVLDAATGLPPNDETLENERWFFTIYDIDVITLYKGEISDRVQMSVIGGIKDYRVEEQFKELEKAYSWFQGSIPINDNMPRINIGDIYLFVLWHSGTDRLSNSTPHQSFFNLSGRDSDPFKKQGFYELDNPAEYYSRDRDLYNNPIISAKDIISTFGDDKWDIFWSDWQRSNPDWDTWIDRSAVEEVLRESGARVD